ncbi:radical SAM protein [Clostridiaceae bacterium M8S5]|nr:radical SAM protein [Clostridiaceae bacterium M8S5]
MGTLLLASILKKEGHDVEIVDFGYLQSIGELDDKEFENRDVKYLGQHLIDKKPDVLAFYTMANSYHLSVDMAKYIKDQRPDIKQIFGGPQASVSAYDLMSIFSFIDVIGIGEGEESIVDIMKAFAGEKELSDIKGICYRDGEKIVINKENSLIQDLDVLPNIDYSLVPYMDKLKSLSIEVGRGCPFGCKYCSSKSFWKQRFRLKSNDRIIQEMKRAIKDYDIKAFSFVHDLFTANKKRIIEFCNKIIKEDLQIQWACSARIDTLDEEVIEMLVKSGCVGMFIGVETGSAVMQKAVNKNLKLDEKFYDKIKMLTESKLDITASFIYGFPNEKLSDLLDTFRVIKKLKDLKIKTIQLHIFSMLRGTEFYNEYHNDISFDPEIVSDITYGASTKKNAQLVKKYPNLFSHFYTMNDSIVKKYKYCDMFINHFIQVMCSLFTITYKNLIEYFDDDLFAFYQSFYSQLEKYADEIVRFSDNIDMNNIEFNRWITRVWHEYINNTDFDKYNDVIQELFDFEKDLSKVIISADKQEELIKTYKFDVYEANKGKSKLDSYNQKETIVRIYKPEGVLKLQRLRRKIS